jgi:hypothetical protein
MLQARLFLVKYHSARLQESAKLVEEEQWIQVDVPADAQRAVDLLVGSAMSDPVEYKMDHSSVDPGDDPKPDVQEVSSSSTAKTLMIEGQSFNIVSATMRSVVLLQDYAKVVVNLDVIVSDVMNRIVEYLKVSCPDSLSRQHRLSVLMFTNFGSLLTPGRVRSFSAQARCDQQGSRISQPNIWVSRMI